MLQTLGNILALIMLLALSNMSIETHKCSGTPHRDSLTLHPLLVHPRHTHTRLFFPRPLGPGTLKRI